jgi:oxygen-independent coproporphyrinogen-3 oxidase
MATSECFSHSPDLSGCALTELFGIYVQVPFCASKCSFCNFSSEVAPTTIFDSYVEALKQEIFRVAAERRSRRLPKLEVDTIYVGGGTPSLLGAQRLAVLSGALRSAFDIQEGAESTLEITPQSADDALLRELLTAGVNRLSIGAQSFDDRELASVGRLHSALDIEEQAKRARQAGFTNLNLDLLAGLPYQTMESWQRSLQQALKLGPEHISVYLFEADEKSRLGREALRRGNSYHGGALPNEDFLADAYEWAREFLAQEGYVQYEISNFALPGYESRHNRKYWERRPYLGFGAGAHSFDGQSRWVNEVSPEAYCRKFAQRESPIAERRTLSPTEQIEEFFFLGLRQTKGVSLAQAQSWWGAPPWNWWQPRVESLEREGWLREQDGWLRLSERAYLVSNAVFQEFLR